MAARPTTAGAVPTMLAHGCIPSVNRGEGEEQRRAGLVCTQHLHPLNLNAALQDFNMVLKSYRSALNHRLYTLADEVHAELIAVLRQRLQ